MLIWTNKMNNYKRRCKNLNKIFVTKLILIYFIYNICGEKKKRTISFKNIYIIYKFI
jgi:hypothetical protein